MKKQKALIFFDIDGTLLPEGENRIPETTIKAIKQLKENGHIPFICTGRCYHQAKEFIEQTGVDNYITSNGEEIFYNNKIIYDYSMPKDEIEEISEILIEFSTNWGYETRRRIFLVENETSGVVRQKLEGYGMYDIEITNERMYEGIKQMWAFGTEEELDEVVKRLPERFKAFRWSGNSLEIISINESKGKSVEMIFTETLNKYNSYAFGDGYNDIELLQTVNHGVAMENGKEGVKAIADYITDDCRKDGIARGLKFLKLI